MSNNGVYYLRSKDDWTKALEIKDTLLVIEFHAVWSGPSRVIGPYMNHFSKQYPMARFYKVDADEAPDVVEDLGIRAIPTLLLFKDGEQVVKILDSSPSVLEAAIKANLG